MFIVDAVAEWGFDLVVSDVDVVWFRDPLPLFEQHAHAGGWRRWGGRTSWRCQWRRGGMPCLPPACLPHPE